MSRFSPRQIVILVVSICAAVTLAPTAVIAAGSFVTLADPSNGSKARVDAGKLRVGDGKGPLTVDGAVAGAIPVKPVYVETGISEAYDSVLALQKHGKASLAVSSITAQAVVYGQTVPAIQTQLIWMVIPYSNFECPVSLSAFSAPQGTTADYMSVQVPTTGSLSMPYPTPLVMFGESTANTTSCLWWSQSFSSSTPQFGATLEVVGFWG